METPIMATPETTWSVTVLRRTAATMPAAIPTTEPMRVAVVARISVAGSRTAISVVTGRPVRADVPRSPVSTSVMNCQYWASNESSRPSLSRIWATCSSLAFSPARTRAGSPGSTRSIRKISTDTPKRVISDSSRVRTMCAAVPFIHGLPRRPVGRRSCPRAGAALHWWSAGRVRVDGVELLGRRGTDAGHVGRVHDRERLGPQEDPRRVVPDRLRGVAVQLLALALVELHVRLRQDLLDLRVGVERRRQPRRRGVRLPDLLHQQSGVEVARGAAEQVHVDRVLRVRGVDPGQERREVTGAHVHR